LSLLSFRDPPPPQTYTLSLHDALPIFRVVLDRRSHRIDPRHPLTVLAHRDLGRHILTATDFTDFKRIFPQPTTSDPPTGQRPPQDRKSTRLNSSHVKISYAVFCLKKKK